MRVRRAADEAREHILAAAEKVLIEQGPLALKLTEVASMAGVANGNVLHHFGSIDGLHTALMEWMTQHLVAEVLAIPEQCGSREAAHDAAMQALFDVFETRGAARLAAWLELTGEWKQLTHVREAVRSVVARRAQIGDLSLAEAEDQVLINLVLAMGAGLFGRSLAQLIGKPAGRTRKIAIELMRAKNHC